MVAPWVVWTPAEDEVLLRVAVPLLRQGWSMSAVARAVAEAIPKRSVGGIMRRLGIGGIVDALADALRPAAPPAMPPVVPPVVPPLGAGPVPVLRRGVVLSPLEQVPVDPGVVLRRHLECVGAGHADLALMDLACGGRTTPRSAAQARIDVLQGRDRALGRVRFSRAAVLAGLRAMMEVVD